jgi:phage tail-like protein
MATRENPYGAFNFLVRLGDDADEGTAAAGFAEVTGLESEIVYAEYRNGNDKQNHVRKVPTLHKTGDVTLKRGITGDAGVFAWLEQARTGVYAPRTVVVTLLDETRTPVARWTLRVAQPKKWVGPTLVAKGGGDVAIEELVLVAEGIDFEAG